MSNKIKRILDKSCFSDPNYVESNLEEFVRKLCGIPMV